MHGTGSPTDTKRFARGVHPPGGKSYSADQPTRPLPTPKQVLIPLSQHIGAPCKAIVDRKAEVTVGQKVGEASGAVSAPVHSSVNGKVKEIAPHLLAIGIKAPAVVIDAADHQPELDVPTDVDVPDDLTPQRIGDALREAGVVGMGGAAFPTYLKLLPNPEKPIDTAIINGCECEPYLTADYRIMLERPRMVAAGLKIILACTGAETGLVAIEDNKPDAIDAMADAIRDIPGARVVVCQTQYPMGGERTLLPAVTGRVMPTGGLPLDVGAVVQNVGTAVSIAEAVVLGRPVTHRVITVTGPGIKQPSNLRVPIGTRLSDVVDACGGLTDDAAMIILGGPMMGPTAPNLDLPVVKGTSGLTVFTESQVAHAPETACIRCGRCVDYCPLNLMPTKIAHAVKAGDLELAQYYDLMACVECGCCTYVCPASIPLVQHVRAGKAALRRTKPRGK